MSDENKSNNVVPFGKGSRRKDDQRQGAKAGRNGSSVGYEKALNAQRKAKGLPSSAGGVRWYHYVQVIFLMLLVAWLMKSCQI